jgi:hypothetical protein
MQVARIEDDMTTGTYAKDTRVSVERTRNAIERTLARYGASGFGYMRHEDRHMLIFEAHHRRDLTQRWRIPRGVVRAAPLRRDARLCDRPLEDHEGRFGIASLGEGGVDALTVLIDRPIARGSWSMETDIRFITTPCSTNVLPVGPSSHTK